MMDGDGPMPALLTAAFRDAGLAAETVETARAPYIPLPATWDDYLKGLSCTHRRQVTRSLRAFDQWAGGEASLERATDLAGLEKGKRILRELHHARWEGGGQSGVFRSPLFLEFHDTIMPHLLGRGALELTWLTVRGEPVAALYGMTWGDKVTAYQTGRRPDAPAAVRPGGVILAYAIRAAIEAGRREFDLLADEAPYKMQLAPAARPLVRVPRGASGVAGIGAPPDGARRGGGAAAASGTKHYGRATGVAGRCSIRPELLGQPVRLTPAARHCVDGPKASDYSMRPGPKPGMFPCRRTFPRKGVPRRRV